MTKIIKKYLIYPYYIICILLLAEAKAEVNLPSLPALDQSGDISNDVTNNLDNNQNQLNDVKDLINTNNQTNDVISSNKPQEANIIKKTINNIIGSKNKEDADSAVKNNKDTDKNLDITSSDNSDSNNADADNKHTTNADGKINKLSADEKKSLQELKDFINNQPDAIKQEIIEYRARIEKLRKEREYYYDILSIEARDFIRKESLMKSKLSKKVKKEFYRKYQDQKNIK